jgi:hypothetical protein
MAPLTAPVLVGCLLLVVAGGLKRRRPVYTVGALRSVGLPGSSPAARALGLAEVALGTATALTGNAVLLVMVAATYAAFTAFVARALATGGAVASCGCVGRPDTPPTVSHLVVTAGLALAAAAAAVHAGFGGPEWFTTTLTSVRTIALLAFTALATWLTWLALAVLPQTHVRAIRRRET